MFEEIEKFIEEFSSKRGVISSKIYPLPENFPYYKYFKYSKEKGYLDGLDWLNDRSGLIESPVNYFKGFNSIILFFFNYYTKKGEERSLEIPKISLYAQYEDYHRVIGKFLKTISAELKKRFEIVSKGFVDSSPFLERGMAYLFENRGFLAKNSLFYLKGRGSYFFIGELILNIESERKHFERDFLNYCKNCNRCVDSCPTGAIVEPGFIDTKKCISYHTIENRGVIPEEIAQKMEGYIFGCDICQRVCPLNESRKESSFNELKLNDEIEKFDVEEFISLSKNQYEKRFRNSAIIRANFYQILRNIYIISEIGYLDFSISKKIFDKFSHRKEINGQFLELK